MKKQTEWVSFDDFFQEQMKDPEFKKEYDALEEEDRLIRAVLDKRIEKNMTQKDLADKIGTKQSAISRLESGGSNPSFKFLQKIAKALDSKLEITFK